MALDADTGKLKWYYQQIPHDVWDFDTAYENILLDLPVDGKPRKLLLNVNKSGHAFVIDRSTGKFVSAYPTIQNFNWIKSVSSTGELLGRNEPEVGKSAFVCPAIGGGRQWNQASYSPKSNLLFNAGIEWCQDVVVQTEDPREGSTFFGGTFTMKHPPNDVAHGHLDAFEPVTGKKVWSYRSKFPLLASILSTAGDLVFTGDPQAISLRSMQPTARNLEFPDRLGASWIICHLRGKWTAVHRDSNRWGSAVAGLFSSFGQNRRSGVAARRSLCLRWMRRRNDTDRVAYVPSRGCAPKRDDRGKGILIRLRCRVLSR
ncbi:MAG: hypothetical protein WKF37_14345 [Bryobacteraceae bacterium]